VNTDDAPPIAARIQSARVRVGLDERTMAERIGISLPAYFDLEMHNDEVFTCLSLDQVRRLARTLGVSIVSLVADDPDAMRSALSMSHLVERLRQRLSQEGITADAFSDRVGWDITAALSDPESAWHDWNIDCLRDVSTELGVEWLGILSDPTTST